MTQVIGTRKKIVRFFLWFGAIAVLLFVLLVYLLNGSDSGFGLCDENEVYRETSGDEVVDVLVHENNCGATTSLSFRVYIVPIGESVGDSSPVFIADHTSELKVQWMKPKLLLIDYKEARIFSFTNFWHSKNIDNFMYEVAIKEKEKN